MFRYDFHLPMIIHPLLLRTDGGIDQCIGDWFDHGRVSQRVSIVFTLSVRDLLVVQFLLTTYYLVRCKTEQFLLSPPTMPPDQTYLFQDEW